MDYIKWIMSREDKQQIAKKSIVDYIRYSIKDSNHFHTHVGWEYNFLIENLNGTNKLLTHKQLAVFCSKMVDIMISYYKDKEVTAGTNEFFSMYQQLGEHQLNEKAFLAFDFFFTKASVPNYPFKYYIDKKEGKVSCGRDYGQLQSKRCAGVLKEEAMEEPVLDDFLHLWPFGRPGEETKRRIYINTTPENATQIALELFKKCAEHPDDKNYRPYVKFATKDKRNDTMLAYCTEKNFDIMFDLVHEIYMEHKEWFNGTGKLPLTAQVFNEKNHLVLGVADEPTIKGTSFNYLFCEKVVTEFVKDLGEKTGRRVRDLPADVIDKYVTYEAIRPYIEKTCYSADYPFLTKETVKNKKLQVEKTVENNKAITEETFENTNTGEETHRNYHFQHLLKKSDNEIAKEQANYDYATSLVYGTPKTVCPYYFVDNTGKKFELARLSESQILNFCTQSMDEMVRLNNYPYLKNVGQLKEETCREAYELLGAVEKYCQFEPSWDGMKTIVKYTNADSSSLRSFSNDLFGSSKARLKLQEIESIARFVQESQGNFGRPTTEQMFQVIDQKIKNEKAKKANFEKII